MATLVTNIILIWSTLKIKKFLTIKCDKKFQEIKSLIYCVVTDLGRMRGRNRALFITDCAVKPRLLETAKTTV